MGENCKIYLDCIQVSLRTDVLQKPQNMLQMTEEEKQKIEALLRRCRRQTLEIERDQKDWEERNKAMKVEQEHQ